MYCLPVTLCIDHLLPYPHCRPPVPPACIYLKYGCTACVYRLPVQQVYIKLLSFIQLAVTFLAALIGAALTIWKVRGQ